MSDALSNLIIKGTLTLLVAFSIATWTVVVVKALQNWRARRQDAAVAPLLGSGRLPDTEALRKHAGPTARVAIAGLSVWDAALPWASSRHVEVPRDLLERSLRQQIQRERRSTESGLAILASIGTTSPFVGLFGTVWGIMHALESISSAGSASLDVVAGPIGEALIATGIGIAVAVPAVLAYNFFVRRLKLQSAQLEETANTLVSSALRALLDEEPTLAEAEDSSSTRLPALRAERPLREASA
jgi:biopolymer transport protein ExbB